MRGVTPAPGARARLVCKGAAEPLDVLILQGHPAEAEAATPLPPVGSIRKLRSGLGVACADGFYVLDRLRPTGRKDMAGADFANGYAPLRAVCPGAQHPPAGAA